MKRILACAIFLLASIGLAIAQTSLATTTVTPAVVTTGNTFQTFLPAASPLQPSSRRALIIQNNNTTATDFCWVFFGTATAAKGTSYLLAPGQAYERYYPYVPSDAIQATCVSNNNTLFIGTN